MGFPLARAAMIYSTVADMEMPTPPLQLSLTKGNDVWAIHFTFNPLNQGTLLIKLPVFGIFRRASRADFTENLRFYKCMGQKG